MFLFKLNNKNWADSLEYVASASTHPEIKERGEDKMWCVNCQHSHTLNWAYMVIIY